MANRRRKTQITPEEQARYDETTRLLEERIAYHQAKIDEERARKERRGWLPRFLLPGRS